MRSSSQKRLAASEIQPHDYAGLSERVKEDDLSGSNVEPPEPVRVLPEIKKT